MSDVKSSASWAGNARVLLLVHGVAKRFEQSCEVSRMKIQSVEDRPQDQFPECLVMITVDCRGSLSLRDTSGCSRALRSGILNTRGAGDLESCKGRM